MRLRVHLPEETSEWESNVELFRVGRADTCALRFEGEAAKYSSWEHAEFGVDEQGRASVTDLGSSNGTYVDGVRIAEPTRLRPGMTVQIGTKGPRLDVLELPHLASSRTPLPVAETGPSISITPEPAETRPKAGWREWAVAGALGLAILAVVAFFFRRGGSAPPPDPARIAQAPDENGRGGKGQPNGNHQADQAPKLGGEVATNEPHSGTAAKPPPAVTPAPATVEPPDERPPQPNTPAAPRDAWAQAKAQGLAAYRLIAIEDAQTQTAWPLAGAVVVDPQTLLTSADVGVEMAKFMQRGLRAKVMRDSHDIGVAVERVRIHAAFQKAEPDQQLYFDLALVSTKEHLTGAAALTTADDLAEIERGLPLACAAIDHTGEPIDRFQQLQPEWRLGKVFALTALSKEAGAPRLLHLRGALSEKSSGSPIFNDRGQLVAIYCEAAPDENDARPERALHYAKLIEPKLIELGLTQPDNPVWVAPVVPPTEPAQEEPVK